MKIKMRFKPAYWAILIFIAAQIVTFSIVSRMDSFLEANEIYIPPQSSPETISFWPQTTPGITTDTGTTVAETPAPFWT